MKKAMMMSGVVAILAVCVMLPAAGDIRHDALKYSWVHRGDGFSRNFNRPENSLDALLFCWNNGAIPEADIRQTREGNLIAYHNATMRSHEIGKTKWEYIRDTANIGAWRGEGGAWENVQVATFEAIFGAMKGIPQRKLFMDWKDAPMDKVAAMVKDYGLEEQVYCHGCSTSRLRSWKKAVPNGKTSLWLWIGEWKQIDFNDAQKVKTCEDFMMKMFDNAAKDAFASADMVHLLIQCDFTKADPYCPSTARLKEMIQKVHAAGKIITAFPWAEDGDREDVYVKLLELGFDGCGTDYADVMYRAVKSRFAERFVDEARELYGTEGWTTYTNSLTSSYRVKKYGRSDFAMPGGKIRWYDVEGVHNVRDIGGWNGLPTGLVLRGGEMDGVSRPKWSQEKIYTCNMTLVGQKTMTGKLGVKTDLDLRGVGESLEPDKSILGDGVKLVRAPVTAYTGAFTRPEPYAVALRAFADKSNYPIYVHCAGGADRTGTVIYLIQALCGVNEIDLAIEYELTTFSVFSTRSRTGSKHMPFPEFVAKLKSYPGPTLAEKTAAYMETTLGLTKDEIAAIRKNLAGRSS